VLKDEGVWRSARDEKLASMDGAVVHRTDPQLVVGLVRAAFGSRLNVVHVERDGVPATRHWAQIFPSTARETLNRSYEPRGTVSRRATEAGAE
jgi:hypothetical protein